MRREKEHYVTCGQMKVLEQRADKDGLSYYQMMENAGTGAAEIILDRMAYRAAVREEKQRQEHGNYSKAAERILTQIPTGKEEVFAKHFEKSSELANNDVTAVVFCGKGNNGGDGFVVARLLHATGYNVIIVLVDGEPKTEDAIINFDLLKKLPVKILDMSTDSGELMKLEGEPDLVVDAVYGTGFHGTLRSNALKAAMYINRYADSMGDGFHAAENADKKATATMAANTLVFAIDIPSGLGGDLTNEKELDCNSVKADYTITFHAKKPIHLQKFAQAYCGEILVVDIGIDEEQFWEVEI